MDNLQFFNAQVGMIPGPADFWAGNLSITLYGSLVVIYLNLDSFPLKVKEGISKAIISPF